MSLQPPRAGENRKVLLVANTSWFLYRFNLELATALKTKGWNVTLVAPPDAYTEHLRNGGFRHLEYPLRRRSLFPWTELVSLFHLVRIFRRERPRWVHCFTLKCVLYGSLAARLAGRIPFVGSITGLGSLYSSRALKARGLRRLLELALGRVTRGSELIFLNPGDRDHFLDAGLVPPDRAHLILGSGVDTSRFDLPAEPEENEPPPLVVLPARMLWSKGVAEFVAAAKRLRRAGIHARWALVGGRDPGNPDAVPRGWLEETIRATGVEWWGFTEDMIGVYRRAAIVCLPTTYREGVPTVLLEAAACRRPVVATEMPGCREAVEPGRTGFLVPPGNPKALAQALESLLTDPELRRALGEAGRRKVEQEFSVERVVASTLDVYRRALEPEPASGKDNEIHTF